MPDVSSASKLRHTPAAEMVVTRSGERSVHHILALDLPATPISRSQPLVTRHKQRITQTAFDDIVDGMSVRQAAAK